MWISPVTSRSRSPWSDILRGMTSKHDSDERPDPRTQGARAFVPPSDAHIIGVGIDIVDVARLAGRFDRSPALVSRLLTPSEQTLSLQSQAARVAAKEAVGKALGSPGDFSWLDVTVARTERGKPYLVLSGATLAAAERHGVAHLHLSLSHDAGIATAIVVAERGEQL